MPKQILVGVRKDLQEKYKSLQEELAKQNDSETLKKYEILSEAYKIGKKIFGRHYSINTLAMDFDIPITTTKRVLSLDRANSRTWRFIKQGKLSAFKAAQICSTKNRVFQDEIVDLVIEKELSTYDIKKLRVRGQEDINDYRFKKAIQKGYSRKDSAYSNFSKTIERVEAFLTLGIDAFPEQKRKTIVSDLKELGVSISKFIKRNKHGKD